MENELQIKRLGWAGIQLTSGDHNLVIDLFENRHAMAPFFEEVTGDLPPADDEVDVALVTHLHGDHADPVAIGRCLAEGGTVLRPVPAVGDDLDRAATAISENGLAGLNVAVESLAPWESRELGPFKATAVPASDGFGDPQVSWVVEAGGKRIFHGGDTTFHGAWWPIASRFKPFDAVFLPINGAVANFPHRQPPSSFPACMGPEQAAVAASILGAEVAVPIHYDGIHVPGRYEQTTDPAGTFLVAAEANGVELSMLEPGEQLEWAGAGIVA